MNKIETSQNNILDDFMLYAIQQEKDDALKNGEVITDAEAERRVNAFFDEELEKLG